MQFLHKKHTQSPSQIIGNSDVLGDEIGYPTRYFMESNKTSADFLKHWDKAKEYRPIVL
jgi:hypothetical protein